MAQDLRKHEYILRQFTADERIIDYAMRRMEDGVAKYERGHRHDCAIAVNARHGCTCSERSFIAEGYEEVVDGVNRLVMEVNRKQGKISPVLHETILTALETVRGLALLKDA